MTKSKLKNLFKMPYLLLIIILSLELILLLLLLLHQTYIAVISMALINIIIGIVIISTPHSKIIEAKSKTFDSVFLLLLGIFIIVFFLLVFIFPDLPIG